MTITLRPLRSVRNENRHNILQLLSNTDEPHYRFYGHTISPDVEEHPNTGQYPSYRLTLLPSCHESCQLCAALITHAGKHDQEDRRAVPRDSRSLPNHPSGRPHRPFAHLEAFEPSGRPTAFPHLPWVHAGLQSGKARLQGEGNRETRDSTRRFGMSWMHQPVVPCTRPIDHVDLEDPFPLRFMAWILSKIPPVGLLGSAQICK